MGAEENQEMAKIIADLRKKMSEIDNMTKKLAIEKKLIERESPKKTKKLLEELKVPSLDLLR